MKTCFTFLWFWLAIAAGFTSLNAADCIPPDRVPQRSTRFDGAAGSRMDFAADAAFDQGAPMTIEAWVYRDLDEGVEFVLVHGDFFSFYLGFADDKIAFSRGNLLETLSDGSVQAGRWTHVAVSYDGTVAHFYINGREAGAKTLSGYGGPTVAGLSLGGHPLAGGSFLGNLDEVRLWSVARTQAEIQENLWRELDHGLGLQAEFAGGNNREAVRGRTAALNRGTLPDPWGILPRQLGIPIARGRMMLDGSPDLGSEYQGAEQMVISYLGQDLRLRDARGYLVYTDPGTATPVVYLGVRDVQAHDSVQPFDANSFLQVSVGAGPDTLGNPSPQYDVGATLTVPTTRTVSRLNRVDAPATLALWDARTFWCRGDVAPPCFEFRFSSTIFNQFSDCPRMRVLQLHASGGALFLDASSLAGTSPDAPSPLAVFENWQPVFLLPPTDPPLTRDEVRVLALEVNQAVQDTLFYPGAPGSETVGESTIPLVPRRNTVVRAHVVGAGGAARPGFRAVLQATYWPDSAAPVTRDYLPVNADGQIDLEGDAAPGGAPSATQLQRQRFDLDRTLNFVIPEADFVAEDVGFILWESGRSDPRPFHGQVRVHLQPPVSIGVNVVRIRRSVEPHPLNPATDADIRSVPSQLKQIYPVSHSRLIRVQDWSYNGEPNDGALLAALWDTFGGDRTPTGGLPEPSLISTLGMARGLFENVGLAYFFGHPDQTPPARRFGGTSISIETLLGYGHEIGHNLGFDHFGRSFGVDPESFEYPESQPEFALTTRFTDLRAALGIQVSQKAGQWELSRPRDDLNQTPVPSLAPGDAGPFDIMSYGSPGWISDLTYRRFYNVIRDDATARREAFSLAGISPTGADALGEAMIVRGVIETNGNARLMPVLRKQMPASFLTENVDNARYRVECTGAAGQLLRQLGFGVRPAADAPPGPTYFRLTLPAVGGVRALRLFDGTQLLAELQASTNPPVPRIVAATTLGQEPDWRLRVAWQVNDGDGDPVTTLVQVSYDGGVNWLGVALALPGDPLEAETPLPESVDPRSVMFRVTASDGLNVTADTACAQPSLRIRRTVTHEWSCGVLQAADSFEGPYADIPGAISPFTTEIGPGRRYFRVRLP